MWTITIPLKITRIIDFLELCNYIIDGFPKNECHDPHVNHTEFEINKKNQKLICWQHEISLKRRKKKPK